MRAETGPMKFEEDWTGVFIRGDNAFHYSNLLHKAITVLKNKTLEEAFTISELNRLKELLDSCLEPVEKPQKAKLGL